MPVTQILGLITFFCVIFLSFSLFPRIILTFIKQLLEFRDSDSFKSFMTNVFDMFILYMLLGFPFTTIFYQTTLFGKFSTIFWSVFLFLVGIRLSILLKKKPILEKIGIGTKWIEKFVYRGIKRETLREEYKSYLFGLFFSAFTIGILVLSLKIITSSGDATLVIVPEKSIIIEKLLNDLGKIVIYGGVMFGTIIISEIMLKFMGAYKDLEFFIK